MPEFVGALVGAGDRSSFCIPNGVKQLQVIDVVKQWIDQFPTNKAIPTNVDR